MDKRIFDRLTATLSSGTGRRRAIAGILAGTAVLGWGSTTTAKKRKKKRPKCETVDLCPQRACCSCPNDEEGRCKLIEGSDPEALADECQAFCGEGEQIQLNLKSISGESVNFCSSVDSCVVVNCPVPL